MCLFLGERYLKNKKLKAKYGIIFVIDDCFNIEGNFPPMYFQLKNVPVVL